MKDMSTDYNLGQVKLRRGMCPSLQKGRTISLAASVQTV